ncbi:DUF3622 domain-containing protein [Neptuniibacter sp. SY11_33]|uniref:DUF3622 domain-containing protein n=1 Tax=unclassified Neptuniibacter TaxID=2630693 RepID=UPI0039F6CDC9
MAKGKKYDFQLVAEGETWSAKILRQASARKTVVSKQQDGFATEDEAKTWAEAQLQKFLEQQQERNKRKAEKREERAEIEARQAEARARNEESDFDEDE